MGISQLIPIFISGHRVREDGINLLFLAMILSIRSEGDDVAELLKQVGTGLDNVADVEMPWGSAMGFWSHAKSDAAEFSVLLQIKAAMLNREEMHLSGGHPLEAYVHPLAYSSNSLLSTALDRLFNPQTHSVGAEDHRKISFKFFLTNVRCDFSTDAIEAWCRGWGWEVAFSQVSEGGTSGRTYQDLTLVGHESLTAAILILRALLVALDGDHVQHLGKDATIQMAQMLDQQFPTHPEIPAIRTAILSGPNTVYRTTLGNLAEPTSQFQAAPLRKNYRSEPEQATLVGATLAKVRATGAKSVLLIFPEDEVLASGLARIEGVARINLMDLVLEYLQRTGGLLRNANLTDAEKQKFMLSTGSPVHFGEHLQGYDFILVEGGTTAVPSHHLHALLSALLGHSRAGVVAFVQELNHATKSWANQETAKTHDRTLELVVPKVPGATHSSPMALILFHQHRA